MLRAIFEAARRGAAVFHAPELGTIQVRGADRKAWLNGLLTCDVKRVDPHTAAYGLVLVKIGRIVADVWVVEREAEGDLLLGVARDRIAVVREHFEKYLMMEDASHLDASDQFSWFFAHGPHGEEVARHAARGHEGVAASLDTTGLGGAVLVVPTRRLPETLVALRKEGIFEARDEGVPVLFGTDDDWNALRVAQHLPRFGVDFSDKNYPQEASLERLAVSFTKGCYLGQEVVCRLEMRGHVIKKIVPLEVSAGTSVAPGTEVHSADGKLLGTVSSATSAPGEGGPNSAGVVALAMLRYDHTDPGTHVEVAGRSASVLPMR